MRFLTSVYIFVGRSLNLPVLKKSITVEKSIDSFIALL